MYVKNGETVRPFLSTLSPHFSYLPSSSWRTVPNVLLQELGNNVVFLNELVATVDLRLGACPAFRAYFGVVPAIVARMMPRSRDEITYKLQ